MVINLDLVLSIIALCIAFYAAWKSHRAVREWKKLLERRRKMGPPPSSDD